MPNRIDSEVDLAIVGGGVIGLAVAVRARSEGLTVTVLERGEMGRGTSYVAAGMLAPVAEAEFGESGRAMLELGLRSAEMWPEFAAELERASGEDVGLLRTGTLVLARDADEAGELERQIAFRESLGLRTTRLRGSEAREREPALAPTMRLALEAPDDHSVDPRRVLVALRRACEGSGVRLREHAPVARLELDRAETRVSAVALERGELIGGMQDGIGARVAHVALDQRELIGGPQDGIGARVAGVVLEDGELVAARDVVIAAGPWSGAIDGLPAEAQVPVRPIKGQLLRLYDPAGPGLLERVVRFQGGYLVPRADGRYLLGATVEERGFERHATAGGVYELLRDAHEMVPGVSELQIEELCVGLRPGTPDNVPVIGRGGSQSLAGLTWATGHHRNGILLAPLTAELVLSALVGESQGPLAAACRPDRFAAVPA